MQITKSCLHCGEKFITSKKLNEDFCCSGCDSAYQMVDNFNLSSYYKSRVLDDNIRKIKPEELQEIELESFIVKNEEGNYELLAAIDGISCAACIWLIENILKQQKNVHLARVNLSKKYLKLQWSGQKKYAYELIAILQKIGYRIYPFDEEVIKEEEKKYSDKLVKKMAVAGFGAGNIMLFSIALWFYDVNHLGLQTKNLIHFLTAIIAIPCIIYSASEFFISAFRALKNRTSNMDITISTAIGLTVAVSFYQIFYDVKHIYFDSAMTLCFFLLIGKYFDFKARKKAFDVSREFSLLSSNFARIVDEKGQIKIIAAKNIKKGDILLVKIGEKIAADGSVIAGESEIDNSLITGESRAVKIGKNSEVFAGAINLNAAVQIRVTATQNNSLLKQIQNIIENNENSNNKYTRIADKIAGNYTIIVHVVALVAFLIWLLLINAGLEKSLLVAISILVITCPCALALSVPIAQSLTISYGLKNGIIIKSGSALEKINEVNDYIFDKTGTITAGAPKLVKFQCLNDELTKKQENFYLKIAASLSQNSSHPYAKAITDFFTDEKITILGKEDKGLGLSGKHEGKIAKIGKINFVSKNIAKKYLDKIDKSLSSSLFSYDKKIFICYFADELKSDAVYFFQQLSKRDISATILSGDDEKIVSDLAKKLEIENFYFEQTPISKTRILQKLKGNKKFAMVGDGINDAAALSCADISISFSSATNLTQNVADIIINREELSPILNFLNLAKKSLKIIKQNLLFCLIYNSIAVPFAVLGYVNPLLAALAMSSSSLAVVLNSLRIKNFKKSQIIN